MKCTKSSTSANFLWGIVLWLLFFLLPSGSVAARSAAEIVAAVQSRYQSIASLQADFVQETRSSATSLGTTARGRFYFMKPRSMRWQYQEPEQWFLVVGDHTWHYVPEDGSIYERLIRSPVLLNFFSGFDKVAETFHISLLPQASNGNYYVLELRPSRKDLPVSLVKTWIDPNSYLIMRIHTEDHLGNNNDMTFSNIKLNNLTDPSLFTLRIPPGVQLVHEEAGPSPEKKALPDN
ncbi:MAG: outer membrane lipoprotein carrier protein LolA [Deltaproteobacteria bacterium]|nr:outer membrane lipoprotein carrier protein LolA [Deltaproteobacteria bacterium]MBW2070177.1 outer membrane lipoprotein carrier protein LolA [Deltaproteobacteria bacterium]